MTKGREMNDRRTAALEAQIITLSERLADLRNRPEEPFFTDDNAVISFQKTFGGDRTFTYCAIRTETAIGRGQWWISGSRRVAQPFSWDELLDFMESGEERRSQIWLATNWDEVV
jgi:hypothetical protein